MREGVNVCVSHASNLKCMTMQQARLQRWTVIFLPLLTVRLISAFYSNIADCDETFNYWEPVRAAHTHTCMRLAVKCMRRPPSRTAALPAAWSGVPDLGVLPRVRDPLLRLHRPPLPPTPPTHCIRQGSRSSAWSEHLACCVSPFGLGLPFVINQMQFSHETVLPWH